MAIVSPLRRLLATFTAPSRPAGRCLDVVRRPERRPRPPADVVLPAARRLGPAAHDRADHGVQRLERLCVRELRPELLRRRHQAADLGGDRAAVRLGRGPPPAALGTPAGLARLLRLARPAAAHVALRRDPQRQHQLAGPRPDPDPALGDRQARAGAVGRPCLRQQGPPPGQPPPDHDAGGARAAGRDRAGDLRPRLGTALVLFAILLGMLWVVGAPARFFAMSFLVVSVFAGSWPRPTPNG